MTESIRAKDFDTTDQNAKRHMGDQKLRAHGFRIHARPKNGPTMWERHGDVFTQEQAERIVNREDG